MTVPKRLPPAPERPQGGRGRLLPAPRAVHRGQAMTDNGRTLSDLPDDAGLPVRESAESMPASGPRRPPDVVRAAGLSSSEPGARTGSAAPAPDRHPPPSGRRA